MPVTKIVCANCNELRSKYAKGICERCYKTIRMLNSPMIKCQCSPECEVMIHSITFDGEPRTMKKGHEMTGPLSKNWKNGIRTDKDGYKYILSRKHPYKDSMGYVPQHRLIMEHYYTIIFDEQIYLPFPKFEVNHINEIVDDNSLINLELVTHKEHRGIHRINMSTRFCCDFDCNDKTKVYTSKRSGRPIWRKNIFSWLNGDWLHEKCFRRNVKKKQKMGGN